MAEKKQRKKHVSYQAQREQCRLNKFTYEEKIAKVPYLMCNYPFPQPTHKKGLCKASTCTDMRELPDEIVEADKGGGVVLPEGPYTSGPGDTTSASRPEDFTNDEGAKIAEENSGPAAQKLSDAIDDELVDDVYNSGAETGQTEPLNEVCNES